LLDRIADAINSALVFVAGVSLVTLIVIFGWLVYGRYILNSTPTWVEQAAILIIVIINALKVKFAGYDLLGNPQEAVSGWTFLVVLMSIFFAITCLNLYIMAIYLANIYHEIKKRPLYIIESVQRF